jgi:hypothetical protein
MTLEEAERILGMGCGDYWKKHSDFEFQVEEIPAGKRYGIFREVNNKFEPCVDWQESWVDVIDRLWDVQYDFWSSHEMRAKIVYAVHWVEAPRPGKRREKWSAGMSKTSSRDRRLPQPSQDRDKVWVDLYMVMTCTLIESHGDR